MDMNDIKEKVKEILSKRIDVTKLKENGSLSSLGLDSLDLVEVSLEIEDAFGVEFTSEEIVNLTTLQSMLDLIAKKIK